ncbi:hypothetical protein ACVRXQ_06140 [Streptococcus panodentis]|uniref:hypothetical protein n=1 Tax=Streptococcus panodentis TaxID=1581472 RepID=UPI001FD9B1E4|nr:hypothetical protein [Streptococcus panodentis]
MASQQEKWCLRLFFRNILEGLYKYLKFVLYNKVKERKGVSYHGKSSSTDAECFDSNRFVCFASFCLVVDDGQKKKSVFRLARFKVAKKYWQA